MTGRLLLVALLTSCQCQPEVECTSSVDCGGRRCVDGVCARRDGGSTAVPSGGGGGAGGATVSDGGTAGGASGGAAGGAPVPDCAVNHTGTLTGSVFEPSGQLALPNVLVFVPTTPLDDLPAGPAGRCPGCEADITGAPLVSTVSTATGTFRLDGVPASTHTRLVFQTGRWRREVEVLVSECATRVVDPEYSRLPRSQLEGNLPKLALVTGAVDPLECLLLKLGIDRAEFTRPDAGGAVHLYVDNGQQLAAGQPSGFEFFATGDFNAYDAVLVPCRGNEFVMGQTMRQRVADYVDSGGRFFVTHYGYTWMQGPPFDVTATWDPIAMFAPADSALVVSNFPRGAIYRQWLTSVAMLGATIPIVDARYNVGTVRGQTIEYLGADARRGAIDPHWTAQLSFTTPIGADAGCGRVAFSDFHVSANALKVPPGPPFPDSCKSEPFTDQEKVLVFILFDLGTCPHDDHAEVSACAPLAGACGRRTCCGDLRCLEATGGFCDGGTCSCSP